MINELMCLATAIFFEAGNQSVDGMNAVATTIMNRVEHKSFPDTICGVVTEDRGPKSYDCQFSFYCDGLPDDPTLHGNLGDKKAWELSQKVAEETLSQTPRGNYSDSLSLPGVVYYHNYKVDWPYKDSYKRVGQIGDHIFYTNERID